MIVIEDSDLPITVAQKLVTGQKEFEISEMQARIRAMIIPNETLPPMMDMFSNAELSEIAQYLLTYCENNKDEG